MPYAILVADPLAPTLAILALLWLSAKIGGELAVRLKLPAVAGQLLIGVGLAALAKTFDKLPNIGESPEAGVIAYIGVILLLFVIGLESSVGQMVKVGWASLRVALMGVVAPMILGLVGAYLVLPKGTPYAVDLFIGACLCATSIAISAQVMREKGLLDSKSGRVVVGAAVLDDVLGVLVLAAVSSIAAASCAATDTSAGVPWGDLGKTLLLALSFLLFALAVGRWGSPRIFRMASHFKSEELLLPLALVFAFVMAYLGSMVGLAAIIGAFAAGLVLEKSHVEPLLKREKHDLESMIHPLVVTFAPVFFVHTGASIDPSVFLKTEVLAMIGVLTVAGILGKYLCGFVAGSGFSVSAIGWGMVPRGEIGLVFIAVGREIKDASGNPFLTPEIQAGVLGAILLTTIIGPIGLSFALDKSKGDTTVK